jgi:hypothetical protein
MAMAKTCAGSPIPASPGSIADRSRHGPPPRNVAGKDAMQAYEVIPAMLWGGVGEGANPAAALPLS